MTAAPVRRASSPSDVGNARSPRAGAACLLAALSACAPTGDFGRPAPGVVHDDILPVAGSVLARARGELVSAYRMTDDETTMRDLAWGIVMPPLDQQWRERLLAELRRTRILPVDRLTFDKANYVSNLISVSYRSSAARYARLQEDVINDTLRIEPFFAYAARVADGDRARRRAVALVPEVTPAERGNALARIEENGLMIAWVRDSFEDRLASYRYALDRLVLETPDRASIEVEHAIATFAAVLGSLRPLGPPRGVFKG